MRKINFKVRNIGSEKYLSYILDDECDFDEELLDYLDENKIPELLDIIYEEDDENDYLTYNVTGRTTVGELLEKTEYAEIVLGVIRGIASGIVNMRDLGIPVSDVILHKGFTYVNPVTYDVKLICIPIESDTSLNAEFRTFAKNLLVNATFDSNEDCNYVARVINLLNVEKFTLRTFAAEITELMEAAGMHVDEDYMDVGGTGVEVSGAGAAPTDTTTMDDLPEYKDISFDDEGDDVGENNVYDSEPVSPNTVFKDLNLDAEEGTETTTSGVDMSAFDDSALEELELEELVPEEPEPVVELDLKLPTEGLSDPEDTIEPIGEAEEATVAEPPSGPEEVAETEPVVASEVESTKVLTDAQTPSVTEIAETAEGVTEIEPNQEDEVKPTLIDTADMENLVETPPVVKSIRVNRAKIIQKAATEAEEEAEENVDNPTEQITSQEFKESGEPIEPETNMNPVKESKADDKEKKTGTGTTVELSAGVNVVKEAEPVVEKPAAPTGPKAMPYIVRVNNGERVMINKAVFKLGKGTRGVDYTITGNGAISKVHATISTKDTGCYLKENKATNATYVDGVKLEENQEVKLKNNATITLGDEDFLFKLS